MAGEGWNLSDAETFCNKYGLILEKTEQETSAYNEGVIISQSRTAGTTIVKGTTLRVTVAIKPKEKPKPTPTPEKETTKKASDYTEKNSCEKNNFHWNEEDEKCEEES